MNDNVVVMDCTEKSMVMRLPLDRVFRLWEMRLDTMTKLVNLNAPQFMIDQSKRLVDEAREAIRIRSPKKETVTHPHPDPRPSTMEREKEGEHAA